MGFQWKVAPSQTNNEKKTCSPPQKQDEIDFGHTITAIFKPHLSHSTQILQFSQRLLSLHGTTMPPTGATPSYRPPHPGDSPALCLLPHAQDTNTGVNQPEWQLTIRTVTHPGSKIPNHWASSMMPGSQSHSLTLPHTAQRKSWPQKMQLWKEQV